eukprot:CAMPEP_0172206060 /NCGR_PEP_ID=MMETSP1050-20130122/32993_1 /TAXON_ID=233186 /ORGANISM="Cryptomonas curvata, Strain CCAP979/52" /LENGTH=159 /DNA_ID=CAMNT_0012885071 /DNA_START=304 /DNA_END=784 /DNA_ORIENTATION=-
MNYVDAVPKSDEVVEVNGVKVFVDPKAVMYLVGCRMDFVEDAVKTEFVFENPNAKARAAAARASTSELALRCYHSSLCDEETMCTMLGDHRRRAAASGARLQQERLRTAMLIRRSSSDSAPDWCHRHLRAAPSRSIARMALLIVCCDTNRGRSRTTSAL